MILNEKIKAAVVELTGVNGEDLGIISTKEALQMAKEQGVDLVCLSLASSPPPCQLVNRTNYKEQVIKENAKNRKAEKGVKVKEIRLSAYIEDHDYDTKKRQAERILSSGDAVQLTVKLEKKESQEAKRLIEQFIKDLTHCGKQDKGIQVSGKQVVANLLPL
ncbi:translation initiation factor IF-3 [Brevibacillus formosus]|uniref:Translation initiation factor IF-3 n=1 Tax=Brevibacillus formosus TaxID=54913 RepID=A0A837KU62_9BACL|nr:translation initiation factor IF-3 [Brevibacillus formosus]KLI00664.1 translation initiation factor IF-3 [Brevibacillus formosus]MED1958992.1 translation initiation factor IF-3 [Brevibacillus formosus]PSJ92666.1 translation initiation factor IF-3 [Brevibacillus formosus]GED58066.1 translation initiation factor IF-3 [Brevibacillus formosus]